MIDVGSENNFLLNGDSLEVLKELEDNCIDSVVCDPPYELGFMGKKWDASGVAYNVDLWKKVLRVLKPGGHLLAFGGTRTYHRMAVAIEDAGFEIRDCLQWIYGCLTEDTEILTPNGWERYNKTINLNKDTPILIYDYKKDIYKWEIPNYWQEYQINKDTCYNIKSNNTDQLVSRNHRCLIERKGKLVFVKAEELLSMENMPYLPNNIFELHKRQAENLFKQMQWENKNKIFTIDRKAQTQDVGQNEKEIEQEICNGKESCLERWSNLFSEERELWEIQDKICKMSFRISKDGSERWVCYGTPIDCSKEVGAMLVEKRGCASFRPQSREQFGEEFDFVFEQSGTQVARSYGVTKAKVTKQEYSGLIFCPNVSTGCFVARRNGKVFVTGNSGFPKSYNIGKGVDKLQGNKREIIGETNSPKMPSGDCIVGRLNNVERLMYKNTKGCSVWEGWGSGLKPANEPIVLARKPLSERNLVENCLKWGVGGINIDASRIKATQEYLDGKGNDNQKRQGDVYGFAKYDKLHIRAEPNDLGRFPANVLFDEEAGRLLDEQSGIRQAGGYPKKTNGLNIINDSGIYGKYNPVERDERINTGVGGASRFFYVAKASKRERNEGLEEFEEKQMYKCDSSARSLEIFGTTDGGRQARKNFHPTVKPVKLMEYLVKLVTPVGGRVLDPFMGSGTTGVACVKNGFGFVGVEMDKEYFEIAKARIEFHIPKQKKLFEGSVKE